MKVGDGSLFILGDGIGMFRGDGTGFPQLSGGLPG